MTRELEHVATELVRKIYGGRELATPDWLQHPGPAEAGRRWTAVRPRRRAGAMLVFS